MNSRKDSKNNEKEQDENKRRRSPIVVPTSASAEDSDGGNDEAITVESLRRFRANSIASAGTHSSVPSIETATDFIPTSLHSQDGYGPTNTEPDSDGGAVSSEQERQILLIMLLAQVCALHDPTPKTFTVHVLELFERGILDRDSIRFLFELGLVPSLSPGRPLLTADVDVETDLDATAVVLENQLATMSPTNTDSALQQQLRRSREASAIRSQLSASQQKRRQRHENDAPLSPTTSLPVSPSKDNNHQTWDAASFPLSLSRYQREFTQVTLLNSGAFGQVFHATSKMDFCHYAIKKISFNAVGYSNETIQQVVREVQCLASASDHPNVVRYFTSWLEPSWMTGSGGQVENNVPQHRLLKDLQQLMHPGDEKTSDSAELANDDSYLADPSSYLSSQQDYSSAASSSFRRPRHQQYQRRFSFGSSVDGSSVQDDDFGWESYHDQRLSDLGFSYDDSCLTDASSSRRQRKSRSRKGAVVSPTKAAIAPAVSTPAYRYQICLYIQMQLCHPATLADWIRERNRKVPEADHCNRIGDALDVFEQVAKGLAHIHTKGIIHRDLKPSNIFASEDGRVVKIGDFGLSKQMQGLSANISNNSKTKASETSTTIKTTATPSNPVGHQNTHVSSNYHEYWQKDEFQGALMVPQLGNRGRALRKFGMATTTQDPLTAGIGTASYASPEQVKSRSYGTPADIFSVGLILLELVSCFETEHERLDNFQRCRTNQKLPPWLTESYPDIANVIVACTQQEPVKRPTASNLLQLIAESRREWSNKLYQQHHQKHDHAHTILKGKLVEKEEELEEHKKQLAEKDEIIENLRLEMERMKATMLLTNTATSLSSTTTPSSLAAASTSNKMSTDSQNEEVVVEVATSTEERD